MSSLAFAQSDPALNIEGFKYKTISFAEYIKEVHQNSASINSKQLSLLSSKAMVAPMAARNINPSFNYSKGAYYNLVPYSGAFSFGLAGLLLSINIHTMYI